MFCCMYHGDKNDTSHRFIVKLKLDRGAELAVADLRNPIRIKDGFFPPRMKSVLEMSNICSDASRTELVPFGYITLPL